MKITVQLNNYNNDWYKKHIGASRLKQFLWYCINATFFINPLNFSSGNKIWLLKRFGAVMGKNVIIKPGVNIKYPWLLFVDDFTWIGERVWIDNLARVVIGKNVCLSQGAMLLTGNHNYKKSGFDLVVKDIHIQDGVWIGARAIVCPGVICESHSILTASSIAASNMASYKIYQGNPAVEIRERIISS
jgi:putative colanic acid biosynthesis acetyltransferase WcaF